MILKDEDFLGKILSLISIQTCVKQGNGHGNITDLCL